MLIKKFSSEFCRKRTLKNISLVFGNLMKNIQGYCFEEPENGIHPFRIKAMTELLKDLSVDLVDIPLRQVIVNTHSPVFWLVIWILGRMIKSVSIWYAQMRDFNIEY
jgi:predicted ATP-dependent endonuclease of OLD family